MWPTSTVLSDIEVTDDVTSNDDDEPSDDCVLHRNDDGNGAVKVNSTEAWEDDWDEILNGDLDMLI